MRQSKMYVLVGPSASGKSALIEEVMRNRSDFCYIKSLTTRPKRSEYESNYRFVGKAEFDSAIQTGALLEWSTYAENLYGTAASEIELALENGINGIKAMDYNGACAIKRRFNERCVTVFIHRPMDVLLAALRSRKVSEDEKTRRIASLQKEMKNHSLCDAVLQNKKDLSYLYQQFDQLVEKGQD